MPLIWCTKKKILFLWYWWNAWHKTKVHSTKQLTCTLPKCQGQERLKNYFRLEETKETVQCVSLDWDRARDKKKKRYKDYYRKNIWSCNTNCVISYWLSIKFPTFDCYTIVMLKNMFLLRQSFSPLALMTFWAQ